MNDLVNIEYLGVEDLARVLVRVAKRTATFRSPAISRLRAVIESEVGDDPEALTGLERIERAVSACAVGCSTWANSGCIGK